MDSIKDLVRQKLRIEDVIGSYVTIIPSGKTYKACCPFHNEKTPSFNINSEKQMFYCFGCKKGGDLFTFIQEIEHIDFKEALKMLAEKAGVDMHQSAEIARELKQKKILLDIHEYATRFYQLLISQHPAVLGYLEQRGMTIDTIKKWRIGYAPDGFGQLIAVLRKKGFSDNDLVASGLIGRGDKGIYDRFRGRIMFPICDSGGKVIGFSGRIMPGTNEALRDTGKYINSPETMLYHKSKVLFGLHHAKSGLMEKKSVILVEGQFDAILLSQAGYENTVAVSGTAATENHIEQLVRFVSECIIATDSDRAGIQSANHIAGLVYQFDRDVSMITLPNGKDPADIIRENPDLWNDYIHAKTDYITFHLNTTKDHTLRDRLDSIQKYLFPVLSKIQNNMYRDAKLQSIAKELNISVESIRKEFQKFYSDIPTTSVLPHAPENKVIDTLTVQIQELAFIRHHYPDETGFWFIDHPEANEMIVKHAIPLQPEYIASQSARYNGIDSISWKIRLDTLWIRIQQILIDTQIGDLRKKMASATEERIISELQNQLLLLRTQKEDLIHSLSV